MSTAARAAAGAARNRLERGQLVSHGVGEAITAMQCDMDRLAHPQIVFEIPPLAPWDHLNLLKELA